MKLSNMMIVSQKNRYAEEAFHPRWLNASAKNGFVSAMAENESSILAGVIEEIARNVDGTRTL
jgi:hypothetical protein